MDEKKFTYEQISAVLEEHASDKIFVCRHCLSIEVRYKDNLYNYDGNGSWAYFNSMDERFTCNICNSYICDYCRCRGECPVVNRNDPSQDSECTDSLHNDSS